MDYCRGWNGEESGEVSIIVKIIKYSCKLGYDMAGVS